LAGLFVGLWLLESIADEQHFQFQTLKHSLSVEKRQTHANAEIRDGFYQSGLFAISRHPNYFAEQVSLSAVIPACSYLLLM